MVSSLIEGLPQGNARPDYWMNTARQVVRASLVGRQLHRDLEEVIPLRHRGLVLTGLEYLETRAGAYGAGDEAGTRQQLETMLRAIDAIQASVAGAWRAHRPGEEDPLLGIPSRKAFDEDIANALREASQTKPLSLLFVDIDDFKRINDSKGHQAGDRVLQGVASRLKEVAAERGKPYRYGGEELTLLLPNTTHEEALSAGERARQLIAGSDDASPGATVTASIGVSTYPSEGVSGAPDLILLADQRMYAAKKAGKNRVLGAKAALVEATGPAEPSGGTEPDPFLLELLVASLPDGDLIVIDIDQGPPWVRAGTKNYRFDDPAMTAGYRDALRRGQSQGFLETAGERAYRLTANGFALARENVTPGNQSTEAAGPSLSLRPDERRVIQFLANNEPASYLAGELEANLGLHEAVLAGILRRLDDHGLLEVRQTDRAGLRYRLTSAGRDLARSAI